MRLYFFFVIFLLIPVSLGQDINFFKSEYILGETVQLEVSFSVDLVGDLTNSQIKIYDQDDNLVSLQPNLVKISRDYYLVYFDTPLGLNGGQYTFLIKNVLYLEGGVLKSADFEANFNIVEGGEHKLRLLPGALHFQEGGLLFRTVRISNLEGSAISLHLDQTDIFMPSISLLQISGYSSRTFFLYINLESVFEKGLYFFNLNDYYFLPVYLDFEYEEPESVCFSDWQCSDWGDCDSLTKTERRECVDVNSCAEPCSDNSCTTVRNCVPCVPNWQCSGWSACVNGIQTRTCSDVNNCGVACQGASCSGVRTCTLCVPNWKCTEWSKCNSLTKKQTRSCVDNNHCGISCSDESCAFVRNCVPCVPNWFCSYWSECSLSHTQTRNCVDFNSCGEPCSDNSCTTVKSCVPCVPNWQCSLWSDCKSVLGKPLGKGEQTRSCSDVNNCGVVCQDASCSEVRTCDYVIPDETVNETKVDQIVNQTNYTEIVEVGHDVIFFIDSSDPSVTVSSLTNVDIPNDLVLKGPLFIKNVGEDLINIKFSLTGNLRSIIRLNVTNKTILARDEVLEQFIWVNENKRPREDVYQGEIILKSNELSKGFPVYLSILREKSVPVGESDSRGLFTEEEVQPVFYQGEGLDDFDEFEEEPEVEPKAQFPYKSIAIILLIVLLVVIYLILRKPTTREISFEDIVSKKK